MYNTVVFKKRITVFLFTAIATLMPMGCTQLEEPKVKGFHFYFILSPVDEERSKNAINFFPQVSDPSSGILYTENKYSVIQVCQGNNPNFLVPGISESGSDRIEQLETSVTTEPISKLTEVWNEWKNGSRPCNADVASVPRILSNLSDAASQGSKLIVIWQFPWEASAFENSKSTIEEGVKQLIKQGGLHRLLLWDINSSRANPDDFMKAFSGLKAAKPQALIDPAVGNEQLKLKLSKIRNEDLQVSRGK